MKAEQSPLQLTSFQLFCILFGTMLGFGSLNIARFSTLSAGRDGWISVLLGGLLILGNTWIVIKLNDRFLGKTLLDYAKIILGRFWGNSIGILWTCLTIVMAGFTLSFSTFVIHEWILIYTPPMIISGTLLLLCVIVSIKDLQVFGRMATLIFFTHVLLFVLFIPPVTQTGSVLNLLPVAHQNWLPILFGIPLILYSFAGYELIVMFYAFTKDKKKAANWSLWSIISIVITFCIAVITQVITFPIPYIQKLWLPSLNFISLISISFIERLDLFFITSWIFVFFKVISGYYFAASVQIQQLFSISNRKKIVLLLAIPIFLISFFVNTAQQIDQYTFWAASFSVGLSLVIPGFLLIMSILLKKRFSE